jgi:hypothetical protein
MLLEKKK